MLQFGEVRDPDEATVSYIEDVVRGQLATILIAACRGARSITAADVLFACRQNPERIAQLRNVLSWSAIRRKVSELDDEVEPSDELPERETVSLPWELETVFSFGEQSDEPTRGSRELDDATAKMSREEYEGFAQSRTSSFVHRKAKRFREFLNLSAYLDAQPDDDVLDLFGYLAYETCRELCLGGLAQRAKDDAHFAAEERAAIASGRPIKRSRSESSSEVPSVAVPLGPFSLAPPVDDTVAPPPISAVGTHSSSLPPLTPRKPLTVREVDEALMSSFVERTQRQSRGMRNWRSGHKANRSSMTFV